MKKIKITKSALECSLLFGLLCAIFLSFANFDAACSEIKENVLRLHIVANSDSETDQNLKFKVRDAILSESDDLFEKESDLEVAIEKAESNLPKLKSIAQKTIKKEGFDYDCEVKIGTAYFNTRVYDDFTLPAGEYRSLIINIGESKGKNWWCVIFPQVCIPAATKSDLSDSVSANGVEIAKNSQKYIMRFKTVEIYEDIKQLFKRGKPS